MATSKRNFRYLSSEYMGCDTIEIVYEPHMLSTRIQTMFELDEHDLEKIVADQLLWKNQEVKSVILEEFFKKNKFTAATHKSNGKIYWMVEL